jgi:zinc protease
MLRSALLIVLMLPGAALGQARDWPSERPPRPLKAREVNFPPYEIRTLKNGLQVVAVAHHEQPAVSLRLIVRAGGAQDPAEKPGVATLAAALLDQGTTTRRAPEIAGAIDSIGGAMGTGAGTDLTFVNAVVMKDSFDFVLKLVAEVARHPAFHPEEIERQRQQMLSALRVSYDDADYIADVVFDRLVYGFHPYGRPAAGTPESIGRITREDLLAFHGAYFAPNNAILAIVGDVALDEAFAGAERAFGDWPRNDAVKVEPPPDPPAPTRRVVVIDRPGAVQTEIRVGHIAVPRRHRDYMALNLATKILGGEGSNRLHRVLRSERGLTYGASADLETLKFAGDLIAKTDTRSDATGEVLRLVVEEFWRLQRDRVMTGELQGAQDYLAGSFPLTIETPSAIALQVLNALFFGLDLNDLQTFRQRVNAVTPDDIQRVSRAYLKPDRLSIVLVGDASTFASQLRGAGFPQFELVPLSELDLSAADFRRRRPSAGQDAEQGSWERAPHGRRATVAGPRMMSVAHRRAAAAQPGEEEATARGRALVDRAIQAKGGLARLRAIRTVRAEAEMQVLAGPAGTARDSALSVTTWVAYPDRFRVDIAAPAGTMTQVYAEGEAWARQPGATSTVSVSPADLEAAVERDVLRVLLRAKDGELPVRAATDVHLDGRRVLAVDCGTGARTVRLLLDRASGLVLAEQYTAHAPGGMVETEERYADYREVDGVQVPFTTVVRRDGQVVVERRLRSISFNVELPPGTFARAS